MKRRETREVLSPAARLAVLERSCADVSFPAGMLVEKFVWHLPLHRQHKRLEASGGYVAYVAYAKVRAGFVTHAQCWSHARRGFEGAQGAEPRLAGEALALMGALYREEKRIREKATWGSGTLKRGGAPFGRRGRGLCLSGRPLPMDAATEAPCRLAASGSPARSCSPASRPGPGSPRCAAPPSRPSGSCPWCRRRHSPSCTDLAG